MHTLPYSDQVRLQRWHPTLHKRATLELLVTRHMLKAFIDQGFAIDIDDGDGTHVYYGNNIEETLDACFAVEDCYVHVHRLIPGTDKVFKGWVRLVFGNDGYDVVADYTANLEGALKSTNQLAEELAE